MKVQIYNHSAAYARDHDELDAYRASNKANIACKEAIEAAVRDNYRNNILDTATILKQVTDDFSADRVTYVLAATVREKDWDGRISRENKAWAKTIPVCEDRNTYAFVVDQAHTGLVDLLVTRVRKEL